MPRDSEEERQWDSDWVVETKKESAWKLCQSNFNFRQSSGDVFFVKISHRKVYCIALKIMKNQVAKHCVIVAFLVIGFGDANINISQYTAWALILQRECLRALNEHALWKLNVRYRAYFYHYFFTSFTWYMFIKHELCARRGELFTTKQFLPK